MFYFNKIALSFTLTRNYLIRGSELKSRGNLRHFSKIHNGEIFKFYFINFDKTKNLNYFKNRLTKI
ncbi:hypothetical protein BpHYR1_037666 [Brachionus plicatilis]|uniref:Uncharacterized protein n=1 Tax=Brachionus plicatilis TaxID=10195 RepID=A0A3M7P5S3_BRAPC|nr:hypothetical protein BpHYR1_037666 [Brachionus plicatilis]